MRFLRSRTALGLVVLVVCGWYLAQSLAGSEPIDRLSELATQVSSNAMGLAAALACYAAAFMLRAWAWCAVLPGLRYGQSWAALHVSLLGNHVLPLRLGEVLRVTSVLRRTDLPAQPVVASAVTLRAGDLAALILLALIAAPSVLSRLVGDWLWPIVILAVVVVGAGIAWSRRLMRRGALLRRPSIGVVAAIVVAWLLESVVIWSIAGFGSVELSFGEAVAVTSVTIIVQAVAVTPGGFGSYEAAATAALVAFGIPVGDAFALALATHLVKTAYAVVVGTSALGVPAPAYWGRTRLPANLPARPVRAEVQPDAPVVAFLPVHNEAESIAAVLDRIPPRVAGRRVAVIVVDDGSTDDSAARAGKTGAIVVSHPRNLGLGAAVRTGLIEAVALGPAAVVYMDADGEYSPDDMEAMATPVLTGAADYVVGSRFSGRIEHMLARRRIGNRALTAWVRWLTRRRDLTDGQSGYRAFSAEAAAAADIAHDYNYAQVLTLNLLAKGFAYAEVPIRYTFRSSGTSFIRLGQYLRHVVPAVYRELNREPTPTVGPSADDRVAIAQRHDD